MGKKSKKKQAQTGSLNVSSVKRKSSGGDEPPSKRHKNENWYPGKFVLLQPPTDLEHEEGAIEGPGSGHVNGSGTSSSKVQKKINKKKSAGKKVNGESSGSPKVNGNSQTTPKADKLKAKKEESQLARFYENDSTDSGSDDEDWMSRSGDELEISDEIGSDEEPDFESLSGEEEVGEEWTTDTDYCDGDSMDDEDHPFYESDCESVTDDEEDGGNWSGGSDDDSDYVPDVEDRYIKAGDAIMHEAKGLSLAFGNSTESQIIEISEIEPAFLDGSDEEDETPDLIPPEGQEDGISMGHPPKAAPATVETENMLQQLQIDENEDVLECMQLAQFASFYDCIDDRGVIAKLSAAIHFYGILIIRPIANVVQVNGYTLKESESVTSTSISHADYFLNITPVIKGEVAREKLAKQLGELLPHDQTKSLLDGFNEKTDAIVHLQQGLPDTTLEMLKNYSTYPLLPSKKVILTNSPCPSSELILSAKFFIGSENQTVSTFQLNDQWLNVEVTSKSKILVAGGKNVGKSSLCQFLINSSMDRFEKFLLIDLDIGQPICSPAQTVSATLITKPIIGAGYLNKSEPDKCFLYGDKSVMIAPFKYVRCVQQLADFCAQNPLYQDIPWIINTMGYQKGFGLQLICLLIRLLRPTEVVQIQHSVRSYNFAQFITEDVANNFELSFFDHQLDSPVFFTTHIVDSIVNNKDPDATAKWISYATEKRKLSMLAQLSKLLSGNQSCFNDVTPFVAPLEKLKIVVMDEEYDKQQQGANLDLLNGNLVYLCNSHDEESDPNSVLECFGIGIVRGIDKINQQVFLLLPQVVKVNQLQEKVNTLAIGNIPLPAEILLRQSYNITGNVPHVTFFRDRNISSKKYVSKRNIKDCF